LKVYAQEGEFELDPELVRSLVATYPAVNVRRELERMYLWSLKNPSRRWANPLRGIEAWLKRASKAVLEAKAKQKNSTRQNQALYAQGARTRTIVTDAWWTSEEATMRKARELGMPARPGESMADWRRRLADMDKIRNETRAA
jgi:hypothetical protein